MRSESRNERTGRVERPPALRFPHRDSRAGYLLVPVALMLAVVAASAYWLTLDGVAGNRRLSAQAEPERLDYLLESAGSVAAWEAAASACSSTTGSASIPLGQGDFSTTGLPGGSATTLSLGIDQDTRIDEGSPDNTYGNDVELHIRGTDGDEETPLFRFDLAGLAPGAEVQNATGWFFVVGGKGHPEGEITVHNVTSDWSPAITTWNNFNSGWENDPIARIGPQPDAGGWVSVNLTAQVQAWANGAPNFGIALRSDAQDVHAHYSSVEDAVDQRPFLEVVTGAGFAREVVVDLQASLSNGNARADLRSLRVDQPATSTEFQPPPGELRDTWIDETQPDFNYGTAEDLWVEGGATGQRKRSLLRFNATRIPYGARIRSARLELFGERNDSTAAGSVAVYRSGQYWEEGNETGAASTRGAAWTRAREGTAWAPTGQGGSPEPTVLDAAEVPAGTDGLWYSWDVTQVVDDWANGRVQWNLGFILGTQDPGVRLGFTSSDDTADPLRRPRLRVEWSCACGSPCVAPRGSGRIAMFVGNAVSPDAHDLERMLQLQDWGFDPYLLSDETSTFFLIGLLAGADGIFVSSTVDPSAMGTRLRGWPRPLVTESAGVANNLGFAGGSAESIAQEIEVVDAGHYVSQAFVPGAMSIYRSGMRVNGLTGTLAPGLRTLATSAGAPALAILERGGALEGGGTAPRRRVFLPMPGLSRLDWQQTEAETRFLLARALVWAKNDDGNGPAEPLYLSTADEAELGGVSFTHADVLRYTPDSAVGNLELDGKAAGQSAGVSAFHRLADGRVVLSFAAATEFGGRDLLPDDLVVYDPTSGLVTPLLIGSLRFTGGPANISALHVRDDGTLLLASSSDVTIGGLDLRRGDVAEYDRLTDSARLFFDASQAGLPGGVDAFHLDSEGNYVLSTASDEQVEEPSEVDVRDGDVYEYDPDSKRFTELLSEGAFAGNEDVTAIHVGGGVGSIELGAPAGHWRLDEAAGDEVFDSSAYAWSGRWAGPNDPQPIEGVIDGAYGFRSSFDSVEIPDAADGHLDMGSDDFSVSFWLRTSSSPFGQARLVGKLESGADPGWVFYLSIGTLNFMVSDGPTSVSTSFPLLPDGEWHHVVGRRQGDRVELFVDGRLRNSDSRPLGGVDNGQPIVLGASSSDYDGDLDDVRLVPRSLLVEEIESLAGAALGSPGTAPSTGGGGSGSCGYADDFESGGFSGSTGVLEWAGPWEEVGESDGAGSGDIRVNRFGGTQSQVLRVRDNDNGGEGVSRQFDLSGVFDSRELALTAWRDGLDNASDFVAISARTDGGSWTELGRIEGPGTDALGGPGLQRTFDLSDYASSRTEIRLRSSSSLGGSDEIYFDDIEIRLSGADCP